MPTKTVNKSAKIVAVSGTAGFKIGHTCPKCGCDDWYKAPPAIQKRAAPGKGIYKCRTCRSNKMAEYRKENVEAIKAYKAEYLKENSEVVKARKAKYRKENTEAIKVQEAKYRKENADKEKARKAKYRKENTEAIKAQEAKYRKENADKEKARIAKWRKENTEAIKAQEAKWRKENNGKVNATAAKRRATKLNSTPHWLTKKDLTKIKEIYEDCPSGYQVDHILPLQGKHICGLHVPSNLKAIPASENASKCNREPDWTKQFQPGLHP